MKTQFTLAFNEVLEEKQLPRDVILTALESAMVSAYRREINYPNQQVEAKIDPDTGEVSIFAEKEVVDAVQDKRTEVSLEDAQKTDPNAEIGITMMVESTPPAGFGRVAAQTARQVIQQRIRDAERQAQVAFYEKQLGEIVSGVVQAVNAQGLTIGLEMKAEGMMPRKEMINGERFRVHDRVRALVAEVKDSPRSPQIILSRTHRNFLRRLLENEVPEIYHGVVDIRSIAREPGQRAKVAVSATQPGIDPVGACVGIRGVRIQAIVRELHDEKIDVIEWNQDPALYIAKAISPARVSGVFLNERSSSGKTATVVVPEDQLSLAIGRDGQNARLAAKLTSWRIDIKSLPEAASDALAKLQKEPELASIAEAETETVGLVEVMLAKKAEGRPLTPEEYDVITRFVERVEHRATARRNQENAEKEALTQEILQGIPKDTLSQNIIESSLPERVAYLLQESGLTTVGDLLIKVKTQPDDILRLQGIGPKAMQEISKLVDTLRPVEIEEAPAETSEVIAVDMQVEPAVETIGEHGEIVEPLTAEAESGEEKSEVIEGEIEPSLDQLFTLKPDVLVPTEVSEDEEEDESGDKKSKKKKKTKHVEVVYDPDRDMTLVHKKHKREDGGWEWDS